MILNERLFRFDKVSISFLDSLAISAHSCSNNHKDKWTRLCQMNNNKTKSSLIYDWPMVDPCGDTFHCSSLWINSIERTYRDKMYPMKNRKRAFYIFCLKFIMYRGYTRKISKIPIPAEREREEEDFQFSWLFCKSLYFTS